MVSRKELKQMSRMQIGGKLGILFLAGFIACAIMYGLASPFILEEIKANIAGQIPPRYTVLSNVIFLILQPAFTIGYLRMYLSIANHEKPAIRDLFSGFKIWGASFRLGIFISLFTLLWTLLLIIPGIIKAISYSMAFYVLAEKPHLLAKEALNESKRITAGHKMELFVLGLSFIGWILLCAFTLGIAGIYVIPYMNATYTNFYNKIK